MGRRQTDLRDGVQMSIFSTSSRNNRQEVHTMPTDREPYDPAQPFDADELMDGFTEEPERVIHAADDHVLEEMAARARRAWDAFKAEHD